jgi:hypothetical protein
MSEGVIGEGIRNCQLAFVITPSVSPCDQGENRSARISEYSEIFIISGMNMKTVVFLNWRFTFAKN